MPALASRSLYSRIVPEGLAEIDGAVGHPHPEAVETAMVRAKTPEAVAWLISTAVGGVALLCVAAWVYEKTRRHIDHPELGKLTHQWDCWRGLRPHYNIELPAVAFELPGDKTGPSAQDCVQFLQFWSNLPKTVALVRSHAIEEFREIQECYEDEPDATLVEEIGSRLENDEASFDTDWQLAQVSKAPNSSSQVGWTLDFEVSWDIEHTRTAYLDEAGELLAYNLTCAGSGLEDDES
jgi:hypothetical protein